MPNFSPAQASQSRVFLIEGRARPNQKPSYESCMRMTGISRGFGDIERVECPDPSSYGKFVEVAEIRGGTERATTTIEGRYAKDLLSAMLRLASAGCPMDIQLHLGDCSDASVFNTFKKALILESAYITTFGTDDLGTLQSGDNAVVNETGDISAKNLYEILPLVFATQAGTIVTNEVIDTMICDAESCGDCDDESDGCEKIFNLTLSAGGSPGTPADIVFTPDKGVSWYAHDVDTLGAAEDPTAFECLGLYLFVISNVSNSLHYALKSEFNGVIDPAFTEVNDGFAAGGEPNAVFSTGSKAYIVGDGGYVYETSDPTGGVTVVDAGVAELDDLLAVHGISDEFVVAVGNNGAIIWTENGTTWAASTTSPVGVGINLNTVWVKKEHEWWVGTSDGRLFYSLDQGVTWTVKAFPGSGAGVVYSIVFATDSVAYISHSTIVPRARILRSYDGGYSWQVLPEDIGTLPVADRINALAVCEDANFVVGGGLADDEADGYVVMGQTS